jgi:DNA-binding GntR family transcriptional regulator
MARQRLNRSEQAYEHLTEEILRGRWQPGDTLSTYALAEELQISRTPILEALKRLESEGLVEIIPQVGCQVTRPSWAAVAELYALRGALEGLAAEAAASAITDAGLAELRELADSIEAAARRGDEPAFEDLNSEFHRALLEASGLPRVAQTAHGVWSMLRYQLVRVPYTSEHMLDSLGEHQAIYDALERRETCGAPQEQPRCSWRGVSRGAMPELPLTCYAIDECEPPAATV